MFKHKCSEIKKIIFITLAYSVLLHAEFQSKWFLTHHQRIISCMLPVGGPHYSREYDTADDFAKITLLSYTHITNTEYPSIYTNYF